jgi:hypothetical protein
LNFCVDKINLKRAAFSRRLARLMVLEGIKSYGDYDSPQPFYLAYSNSMLRAILASTIAPLNPLSTESLYPVLYLQPGPLSIEDRARQY